MEIPREIERRLRRTREVSFALLFGSQARGRARPDSDWDVAVYLDDTLDARQRFRLRLRLLGELEDLGRADIVVLNEAPPHLGHRALQGKLLFARDRVCYVRYFVRTLGESLDMGHWRDLDRRERRRRLEEGSFGRP